MSPNIKGNVPLFNESVSATDASTYTKDFPGMVFAASLGILAIVAARALLQWAAGQTGAVESDDIRVV